MVAEGKCLIVEEMAGSRRAPRFMRRSWGMAPRTPTMTAHRTARGSAGGVRGPADAEVARPDYVTPTPGTVDGDAMEAAALEALLGDAVRHRSQPSPSMAISRERRGKNSRRPGLRDPSFPIPSTAIP